MDGVVGKDGKERQEDYRTCRIFKIPWMTLTIFKIPLDSSLQSNEFSHL